MAGKINRISAKVIKGIYKDKEIEIEIGKSSDDTKVWLDGKLLPPDALIQSIHIAMRVGKMTTVTIEKFKT